jgi:Domain of unknown function (DUF6265)
MRRWIILAALAAACAAPASGQSPHVAPPPLSAPDWMAGYWLSCERGVRTSETWTGAGSGVLVGTGFTHTPRGVDFEFLRIAPHEGGYAYFGSPRGRPAVAFKLVASSASRVVFENPAHDFPQRITYERTGDALTARIETADGRQAMGWTYRKAPLDTACPT